MKNSNVDIPPTRIVRKWKTGLKQHFLFCSASDAGTNASLQMRREDSGLPSGEVIPDDQQTRAQPWVQVNAGVFT